jgi:hypothetical protein
VSAGRWSYNIEPGAVFDKDIVDLSVATYVGFDALLQVRQTPVSAVLLELSVANGRIVMGTNGTNGTVALHVDAVDTAPLVWEPRAFYDLLISPGVVGDLDTLRLLEGRADLSPPISQP